MVPSSHSRQPHQVFTIPVLSQEKSDIKGKKVVVVHPARIKKLEAKIYQKFKMAFSEYYLNLILLQNYQVR